MASRPKRPTSGSGPQDAVTGSARKVGPEPLSSDAPGQVHGATPGLADIMSDDRRRLLETQEIAGIGSWDWYVDANAVVWTSELYRIHGLDPDGFDGSYEGFIALVHPEDRALTQQTIARALETGEPFIYEHRIVKPNGEVKTLESRGRADVDPAGKVVRLTGTCQDITRRLHAEDELRQAHESYRSLIEAIPAISYIDALAPRVRTIFVSPQVEDILGYAPVQIEPGFWASRIHADERDAVVAARRSAYSRGEDFSCEYRVVTADGRPVWINDQAVIVRDEAGTPVFAQGIMYDISERKRLEDQLVQSQKMEALGRLAGGIAHDFNNLLTVILGNTQLLIDEPGQPPDTRSGLIEIQEAAQLGSELVRQLLGFTRLREGVPRVLDLGHIVRSTQALLRRVIGEDVSLSTEIPQERLPIRIDISQMTQVILNLVVNAREAMPDGGHIDLEVLELEAPEERESSFVVGREQTHGSGPYAALRVTDSGTGMDESVRQFVFEPFFTTKRRGSTGGTGLGLSTVYGIVTRAGGFLSVASKPDAGTTITAYLPLQAEEDDVVILPDDVAHHASGGRVLVVEDDERVRRITSSLLRRSGYEVLEAPDGFLGLEIARGERIDVLLTDVVMPGMDGKALAARVLEVQPSIAILFMSGYAEQLTTSDIQASGVGFIQKPFSREELEEKLQEVMDDRRAERT